MYPEYSFHSIVINNKGEIAHSDNNGFDDAIYEAGWPENGDYLRLTWPGTPPIPNWTMQNWPEAQTNAAVTHYTKFFEFLQGNVKHLEYFSGDKYSDVRSYVANATKSLEMLNALAQDDNTFVTSLVAENHNTPIELLDILSKHKDTWTRFGVARNPNTSIDTLKYLLNDNDEYLRWCVKEKLENII